MISLDNVSKIIGMTKGNPWSLPMKSLKINGNQVIEPLLNIADIAEKPGKTKI